MATHKAAVSVKIPLPGKVASPSAPPQPAQPTAGKNHCVDSAHLSTADCVSAMLAHNAPVNGVQKCSLVAARNALLSFRSLMGWADATANMPVPKAAETAGDLWIKFDRMVLGCTKHLVDNLPENDLYELLGAYVDFGDRLRASTAAYMRVAYKLKLAAEDQPELVTQLNRLAGTDAVLQQIWDKLSK